MPWCGPQVVGIPDDCSATGLLGSEAYVNESQRDRMVPFYAFQNDRPRWRVKQGRGGEDNWLTTNPGTTCLSFEPTSSHTRQ